MIRHSLALLFLCSALAASPLRVFVSIGPQLECVRRIGGDLVRVEALLPPGSNPETFSAGPRKLSSLGRADIYFRIGVPFETVLLEKILRSFPGLRVIDSTVGMRFRHMEEGEACELEPHAGGKAHGHVHSHEGVDPHVWLSISNMVVHARIVARELGMLQPQHGRVFSARAEEYIRELELLDRELKMSLARYRGREVVVFHPAFGYFLNHYSLKQRAVELGGKEPGGRHLAILIRHARGRGVRNIYVQPQFNRKASEVIAREIGGVVMVLDPLPDKYMEGMLTLCRRLVHGFETSAH